MVRSCDLTLPGMDLVKGNQPQWPQQLTRRRWPHVVLMLGRRRRRRPNIKTTLGQYLVCSPGLGKKRCFPVKKRVSDKVGWVWDPCPRRRSHTEPTLDRHLVFSGSVRRKICMRYADTVNRPGCARWNVTCVYVGPNVFRMNVHAHMAQLIAGGSMFRQHRCHYPCWFDVGPAS